MKTNIREYNEEMNVELDLHEKNARHILRAYNEAGFNSVQLDLMDILIFVKKKLPHLWGTVNREIT